MSLMISIWTKWSKWERTGLDSLQPRQAMQTSASRGEPWQLTLFGRGRVCFESRGELGGSDLLSGEEEGWMRCGGDYKRLDGTVEKVGFYGAELWVAQTFCPILTAL